MRIHPRAFVRASLSQVRFARGTRIAREVLINLPDGGQFSAGVGVWLSHGIEIESTTRVDIGEGTTIQRRGSFNGTVSIGRGCLFAPNVFISSGSHIFSAWPELPIREQEARYAALAPDQRPAGFEDKPVTIGDDCWIGVNVAIMPGVTIGTGCVIGANSVVTKSLPPYSIAVGSPAVVKAKRGA
ncbi:hypothetical protein PanNE5_16500 [Pandoraea sp. NE5]|nr:hypothetical protein PanNE5_16500 [Pandoraea sp. NE5]